MQIRNILKNFLLASLPIIGGIAFAAIVSRVTNFQDGQVLTASQLNSEFNNVVNNVNALNDDNLVASAAIDPKKINASIAGDGISRDGSTGILSANVDDSTLEVDGDSIQIKDEGVTLAKLADLAALSVIGNATNATDAPTAITAGSDELVLRRSGTAIGFGQVTAGGLATDSVTTAKIGDAQVTQAKREPLNLQTGSSSGSFTTTSTSYVNITGQSATITTTGRPIFIGFVGVGDSLMHAVTGVGVIRLLQDGVPLNSVQFFPFGIPGGVMYIQSGQPAGTYTFSAQAKVLTAGSVDVINVVLVVYEL